MNDSHLFLDLEGTVIESWDNSTIINCDKVRGLIAQINPTDISIFSAAIWDERDSNFFFACIHPIVQSALGVTIHRVWPMDYVVKRTKWGGFTFESTSEIMVLVGKFLLFENFCERDFAHSKCFLIDDACPSKQVTNKDNDVQISMININQTEKWK